MVNRLPWPAVLSTRIRPPCSLTIFWLTGRPSPVPRAPLSDTNTWKIFGNCSAAMPMPLSLMTMCAQVFLGQIMRRDFNPAVGAFIAGVDGVGHHVQNGPVHRFAVELQRRQRCVRGPLQLHVQFTGAGLHQFDHVVHHVVQDRSRPDRARALC